MSANARPLGGEEGTGSQRTLVFIGLVSTTTRKCVDSTLILPLFLDHIRARMRLVIAPTGVAGVVHVSVYQKPKAGCIIDTFAYSNRGAAAAGTRLASKNVDLVYACVDARRNLSGSDVGTENFMAAAPVARKDARLVQVAQVVHSWRDDESEKTRPSGEFGCNVRMI